MNQHVKKKRHADTTARVAAERIETLPEGR